LSVGLHCARSRVAAQSWARIGSKSCSRIATRGSLNQSAIWTKSDSFCSTSHAFLLLVLPLLDPNCLAVGLVLACVFRGGLDSYIRGLVQNRFDSTAENPRADPHDITLTCSFLLFRHTPDFSAAGGKRLLDCRTWNCHYWSMRTWCRAER
jgi:hypothetical protein